MKQKGGIMENKEFDLGKYMTSGVERIVKEAVRALLTDPRESVFMARFARQYNQQL